jgi:hypothetical protein
VKEGSDVLVIAASVDCQAQAASGTQAEVLAALRVDILSALDAPVKQESFFLILTLLGRGRS